MSTTPTPLKPCPFCGGGETILHVNKGTWNGQRYGEPVSVEVRHWCEPVDGQPGRMLDRVGRDEASAIAAWNRRAALTQGAGEAVEPVAYRISDPNEPDLGHWLAEDPGAEWHLSEPLVPALRLQQAVAQWQERQQKTETEWTDWYAVSKPLHLLLNPDSRSLVQGGIEYQWRPLYPALSAEGGLWAVNVQGPDDVYPCESRLAALEMANTLNASFIAQQEKDHHEYDPIMRAIVIPWEHSPEEHAAAIRTKGTHD